MSIDRARALRSTMTDAERKLWFALRNRQVCDLKFRRQKPVGPYITDFACSEAHLIVEVDGGQHAGQIEYDEQRTRYLNAQGYQVERFSNLDVLKNLEGVLEQIAAAASRRISRRT